MGLFDRVDTPEQPPELAALLDPNADLAGGGAPEPAPLPGGLTAPPAAAALPMGVPSSGAMDQGRADLRQASMDKRERIMRALTILGPAIAGIIAQATNKNPYGSGAAQGLELGAQHAGELFQHQDEQRRLLREHEQDRQAQAQQRQQQAAAAEIRDARENQRFIMDTQKFMADRQKERMGILDSVAKAVDGFSTRDEYDAYIDRIGTAIQQAGHRDLGPNQLRRMFPFVNAKGTKNRAEKAWNDFWNSKANAGAAQKPDAVAAGKIWFDTDGDGVLRLTPLAKIGQLAGHSIMVDDQGNTITWPKETPQEGKATADGIYQDLLDKDRAEGVKDTPDRRVALRKEAIKQAAEAKPTSATDEEIKGLRADLLRQQVAAGGPGGGDMGTGRMFDPVAVAEGIINGTMPPNVTGRSRFDNAVKTELSRRGFNLSGAALDWQATQKHLASLNGQQQLRLHQSINALPELLDSVDTLAQKWKGGQFPVLNSLNLKAAKGGAYGPDVASVANQLDSQIADVVSDLGNVYMGGNSPTDHALDLARKSLSADWDQRVLRDMVQLAKANVKIRLNSVTNTGVVGASPNNPYVQPALPQQPSAPTVDPNSPLGRLRARQKGGA